MDGFWVIDSQAKVIDTNDAFCKMTGYSRDELLALYINDVEDKETRNDTLEHIQIIKSQGQDRFESRLKRKDGVVINVEVSAKYLSLNGGCIVAFFRDITESKKAEKELRESEERYALINNSSQDIIYSYDTKGRFTSANRKMCELMNLGIDKIIGRTHKELGFPEAQCIEWEILHQKVYDTDKTVISETTTPVPDGDTRYYEVILNPLHDNNGNIIGIGGTTRDITENKQAAKKITQLSRAIEQSPISIVITDRKGNIEYVNPKVIESTGFSYEELIGKNWSVFGPEEFNEHLHSDLWQKISSGNEWVGVFHNQKKNGEFFWESVLICPIKDEEGKFSHYLSVKEDITEKMKAEELLKTSLKEKEALLRELYHRTKNNMQVISAFLSLKSASLKDDKTISILNEMGSRIRAMSLVHQMLYQSQDLSHVALDVYIQELSKLIVSSYKTNSEKIKLNFQLKPVQVLIDTAVPCGLLLNELISNSLKYAFTNNMKGEIAVSLCRTSENKIELIVSDNGIGISDNINLEDLDTLGYRLVKSIAEDQLQGKITLTTNPGVSFKVIFRDDLYTPRI